MTAEEAARIALDRDLYETGRIIDNAARNGERSVRIKDIELTTVMALMEKGYKVKQHSILNWFTRRLRVTISW